jgi:hypothetical protein
MTEWKWEDAASRSPPSSAKSGRENIASAVTEYVKAGASQSHTRRSAETLEIQTENRATTLAPYSHRTRAAAPQGERTSHNGAPDSECCAKVLREKLASFAPDSPGFLPLCECAPVGPDFLCKAPATASDKAEVAPATSAAVIAPSSWVAGAADPLEPPFEQPYPERRGLVERRGRLFLHFCVHCGRWGAYGYGATSAKPGRWYCRMHRPDE